MKTKLNSLTIFFPFFNDAGTVQKAIDEAYKWGRTVAVKLEVIAIHGGASSDNTFEQILLAKKRFRNLVVLDKSDNVEGYAVIKHGLKRAKSEWVFYTDGDLQYHLNDLPRLVALQKKTGADVVNGYKQTRHDHPVRVFLGALYANFTAVLFRPPVRDVTCDFRLIRKSKLKGIALTSKDASILVELLKKLESKRATFAECPVAHYHRVYGTSSYTPMKLFSERLLGDMRLYKSLKNRV